MITQVDSENGEASEELIQIVQTALDPDTVRPVGDRPSSLPDRQIRKSWKIKNKTVICSLPDRQLRKI